MKNHYVRLSPKNNKTLSSEIESVLIDSMPTDKLVDTDEIYRLFEIGCQKNSQRTPTLSGTIGLLKSVCSNGFVKEIAGIRLERFLDTF